MCSLDCVCVVLLCMCIVPCWWYASAVVFICDGRIGLCCVYVVLHMHTSMSSSTGTLIFISGEKSSQACVTDD